MITAANLVAIDLEAEQRRALLERAPYRTTFDWFGRKLQVRSNQEFEIEALRVRYRSFLTSGRADVVVCAVGSHDEHTTIFAQPGSAYRYPELLHRPGTIAFLTDAVAQHEFFANNAALVSFHAAALRCGKAALAISAASTGGKSTTAFACARRGMQLYSDERCVVIDGSVHPFPRAVNIRAGGIELLTAEEVPDDGGIGAALRRHAGKDLEAAQFSDLLGSRPLPDPARLEYFFFIVGKAQAPAVAPLGLEASLGHLLGAALCGPAQGMDRLVAATRLLRQARAYELTLGTPDDTALVIAAVASGRRPLFAVASR
jgi:hypothetical protein